MEIELDDMILGAGEIIDFSLLTDYGHRPCASFQVMTTPKKDSLVITYCWMNSFTRTFNDREEAFYIDNVNDENRERAQEIVKNVYETLIEEYNRDSKQKYNIQEYVVNTYGSSKKI